MLGGFHGVPARVIREALVANWGLPFGELEYFPEGAGAYHWITRTPEGGRWFVTCDDLDAKPWVGSDRGSVLHRLTAAYAAAMDLRSSGLRFVSAPVADVSGAPLVHLDDRHTLSVFAFEAGERWHWGKRVGKGMAFPFLSVLAELHASTLSSGHLTRADFGVPLRGELEQALDEVHRRWDGGPFAEAARQELAGFGDRVEGWLKELEDPSVSDGPAVLTHGEPHPDNFIRTPQGVVLVDWDTVAMAPPERDLWMLTGAGAHVASAYRDLTGVSLNPDLLEAYRTRWRIADLAALIVRLRDEHAGDADDHKAIGALRGILDGAEPAPWRTRTRLQAIGQRFRRAR